MNKYVIRIVSAALMVSMFVTIFSISSSAVPLAATSELPAETKSTTEIKPTLIRLEKSVGIEIEERRIQAEQEAAAKAEAERIAAEQEAARIAAEEEAARKAAEEEAARQAAEKKKQEEEAAAAAAAKVLRSATATNVLSRSRSRFIIGRFAFIISFHFQVARAELPGLKLCVTVKQFLLKSFPRIPARQTA